MDGEDEGLAPTRRIRERISRDHGNDPRRLVEHYIEYQRRFADRLREAPAGQRRMASKTVPPSDHTRGMCMASNAHIVAERGRREVEDALRQRGVTFRWQREGRKDWLVVRSSPNSRGCMLRVKTRTAGTWQDSIDNGRCDAEQADPPRFWVFVDIEDVSNPAFYIVPDDWMRRNIADVHRAYLERHGGSRPGNNDAKHHAISRDRIEPYRGKWDQLDLPEQPVPD